MTREEKWSVLTLPAILLLAIGLAWAGSQGSVRWSGIPVFALTVGLAFIMNWVAFIPAWLFRTEKFFDLTGGVTFLSVTAVAIALSPIRDSRTWLLGGLVTIWALRLSTFLFLRIYKARVDVRFDNIKSSLPRFFLTWTLQGLWAALTLAAALAAITAGDSVSFDGWAVIGLMVWLFGFGFEVIADTQKSRFKANLSNRGQFIRSGLWAWSRHPNYFGEIVLWIGIAVIALPTLSGWRLMTLVSPLFVILLLTKLSGIPMLEAGGHKKWGGQPEYEAYRANTPVLLPRKPKK